jgi:hypothetical protein
LNDLLKLFLEFFEKLVEELFIGVESCELNLLNDDKDLKPESLNALLSI